MKFLVMEAEVENRRTRREGWVDFTSPGEGFSPYKTNKSLRGTCSLSAFVFGGILS